MRAGAYARVASAGNLLEVREKKGMTQVAAAALLGVSQSTLSRFEGARVCLTIEEAADFAAAYGVPLRVLLDDLDWSAGEGASG